jgi:hypothetical protein
MVEPVDADALCALLRARLARSERTGGVRALRAAAPADRGDALLYDAADLSQTVLDHAAGAAGDRALLDGALSVAYGALAVYLATRSRRARGRYGRPTEPSVAWGSAVPRSRWRMRLRAARRRPQNRKGCGDTDEPRGAGFPAD